LKVKNLKINAERTNIYKIGRDINKRIFLITVILVSSIFAEYMLTKDRTPGGLYVVGPDLSPDSVFGEYLYYSPDAGTTLVKKDSADYGFIEPEYSSIAADFTTGNLYKVQYENLYHSDDYGATWEMRVSSLGVLKISSGRLAGELFYSRGGILRSCDYGESFDSMAIGFIYQYPTIGYLHKELYGFRIDTGELFYSANNGSTNVVVNSIEPDIFVSKTRIRRGHQEGEVYLLSADSLMRSTDHCSTFTRTNPLSLSFDDISPGNNPGELYASRSVWFYDPESGFRGGRVEICFSEDYGRNFSCLRQTASGITFFNLSGINEVEKPENCEIKAYPNPFNSQCRINTGANVDLQIYDLHGKLIESGKPSNTGIYMWSPKDIPSGIYLIKSAGKLGKVTYIR